MARSEIRYEVRVRFDGEAVGSGVITADGMPLVKPDGEEMATQMWEGCSENQRRELLAATSISYRKRDTEKVLNLTDAKAAACLAVWQQLAGV